jgi:hypothetical protein
MEKSHHKGAFIWRHALGKTATFSRNNADGRKFTMIHQ